MQFISCDPIPGAVPEAIALAEPEPQPEPLAVPEPEPISDPDASPLPFPLLLRSSKSHVYFLF